LTPKPKPVLPRPIQSQHLKEDAIGRRGFKWETIKQLFEDFYFDAQMFNEVRRPSDEEQKPYRFVLQFKQGPHYYRMIFDLMNGDPNLPSRDEAFIITIFHDGANPGLPACDIQTLDGSYDLPTENIQ
jgi:hypothetical protein